MQKADYTYAVARVHIHENSLLNKQEVEQLISAPDQREVLRILQQKGWGNMENTSESPDALISFEHDKIWELMKELLGDLSSLEVFRIFIDYHNLKAAIKLAYSGEGREEQERYFMKHGSLQPEMLMNAAYKHDFSKFPEPVAETGKAAYEALIQTGNGQFCDIIVDRQALKAAFLESQKSGSELLKSYMTLLVDSANIKSALRCALTGKKEDFIKEVMADAGTLDIKALADAAQDSPQAVYTLLGASSYSEAVDIFTESPAAFECWRDNQLMKSIRSQRYNHFGLDPLVAFVLGRQNDIKIVKLIFSAKINALSNEVLRERLSETYV